MQMRPHIIKSVKGKRWSFKHRSMKRGGRWSACGVTLLLAQVTTRRALPGDMRKAKMHSIRKK